MANKKRLSEKVAIVTASTAGIGRGIAEVFAREGAHVIVNGRNQQRGEEVLSACRAAGSEAELILGDVSMSATWVSIRDTVLKKFGRIDVLVNNAAHWYFRSALETSEEDWDKALDFGVKAAWLGATHCLPSMIKAQKGNIINISSVMGLVAGTDSCGYVSAKGALNLLTLSLAADYGRYNIRANTLSPGPIASLANVEQLRDPEYVQGWLKKLKLTFYGQPEDCAYAAVYLASDEARFVTGANLLVDGGWAIA